MNANDVSITSYIALYKNSDKILELLSKDFKDQGRYRNIKNPIATTWLISFNQICLQHQLAADYLSFMSCLVSQKIPESLLTQREMVEVISTLTAYSFISHRQIEQSFDLNRLVHLATQSWLRNQTQLPIWADKALIRLASVVPAGGHEGRETWTAYLPHAIHITSSLDTSLENREVKINLLDNIGCCQYSIGQYKAAEGAQRRTLELREKVMGKKHPLDAGEHEQSSRVAERPGKYAGAEEMHRRTLELREKVLGKKHPDTLRSVWWPTYLR